MSYGGNVRADQDRESSRTSIEIAAVAALIAPIAADLGGARMRGGVAIVAVETEDVAVAVAVRAGSGRAALEPGADEVRAGAQRRAQRVDRTGVIGDGEGPGRIRSHGLLYLLGVLMQLVGQIRRDEDLVRVPERLDVALAQIGVADRRSVMRPRSVPRRVAAPVVERIDELAHPVDRRVEVVRDPQPTTRRMVVDEEIVAADPEAVGVIDHRFARPFGERLIHVGDRRQRRDVVDRPPRVEPRMGLRRRLRVRLQAPAAVPQIAGVIAREQRAG